MNRYLLDNRRPEAGERFAALAELFDPWTFRHLDDVGLGEGWRVWEVGAGEPFARFRAAVVEQVTVHGNSMTPSVPFGTDPDRTGATTWATRRTPQPGAAQQDTGLAGLHADDAVVENARQAGVGADTCLGQFLRLGSGVRTTSATSTTRTRRSTAGTSH